MRSGRKHDFSAEPVAVSAYVGSLQNLKDLKNPWVTPNRIRCSRCSSFNGVTKVELNAIRKHKCLLCSPFYGGACRWAMVGELKPQGLDDIRLH